MSFERARAILERNHNYYARDRRGEQRLRESETLQNAIIALDEANIDFLEKLVRSNSDHRRPHSFSNPLRALLDNPLLQKLVIELNKLGALNHDIWLDIAFNDRAQQFFIHLASTIDGTIPENKIYLNAAQALANSILGKDAAPFGDELQRQYKSAFEEIQTNKSFAQAVGHLGRMHSLTADSLHTLQVNAEVIPTVVALGETSTHSFHHWQGDAWPRIKGNDDNSRLFQQTICALRGKGPAPYSLLSTASWHATKDNKTFQRAILALDHVELLSIDVYRKMVDNPPLQKAILILADAGCLDQEMLEKTINTPSLPKTIVLLNEAGLFSTEALEDILARSQDNDGLLRASAALCDANITDKSKVHAVCLNPDSNPVNTAGKIILSSALDKAIKSAQDSGRPGIKKVLDYLKSDVESPDTNIMQNFFEVVRATSHRKHHRLQSRLFLNKDSKDMPKPFQKAKHDIEVFQKLANIPDDIVNKVIARKPESLPPEYQPRHSKGSPYRVFDKIRQDIEAAEKHAASQPNPPYQPDTEMA
ncbi:hypothetical protein ACR9PT_10120 [Piscirickettsia salmonis]|uniref:hypothetical protein n=1 Tax=Piscirickettsia salmonis TaxID=1238 RepID=UPI003EB7A12D